MALALRSAPVGRLRRRPVLVGAGIVAGAAVLVAGGLVVGDGLLPGASEPPGAVEAGPAPLDYAIEYRVTFADGTEVDERIEVSRPFRSAVRSGDGGRVSDLGVLASAGSDEAWVRLEVPLALASGDLRPDAVLAAAIAAGHVEVGDEARIAGTACRDHRFGGTVAAGVLTPVGTVPGEHADVCIDGRGLVLRERWVVDGSTVRERTATSVTTSPSSDAAFAVPDDARPVTPDAGGGAVEQVADDHDPGFAEHWALEVPGGFEHAGRWVVVPPDLRRRDGGPRSAQVALITDAWVRGADLVLLDQGATVAGVDPPWDDRAVTTTVSLGRAGTAQVAWDLRSSEVRIARPDGGFVRVAGTLAPDDLVAIARTLVPADPGGTP